MIEVSFDGITCLYDAQYTGNLGELNARILDKIYSGFTLGGNPYQDLASKLASQQIENISNYWLVSTSSLTRLDSIQPAVA